MDSFLGTKGHKSKSYKSFLLIVSFIVILYQWF